MKKERIDNLPQELKSLVKSCVDLLGEVVQEEAGKKVFDEVERIRQEMVTYRKASSKKKQKLLLTLFEDLQIVPQKSQHQIARAFSLMLELINSCETAYRTYRLREERSTNKLSRKENRLVYVLTAHPTEARTPQNIELFHRIQDLAVRILEQSSEVDYLLSIIKHNLKLAWLMPVTRHEKPQVVDEAKHLFSIVLRPDIFDTLLRANRDLGHVRVRTWVGGDKDGHPGVDEKVMLACLQASRDHFFSIVGGIVQKFQQDTIFIEKSPFSEMIKEFKSLLKNIRTVKKGDSPKVVEFRKYLKKLDRKYQSVVGARSPRLRKLDSILELFPGLVIPIELREDSEVIAQALQSEKPLAIERMLRFLKDISGKGNLRCYAQGMIISMCESYEDITNTMRLVKSSTGGIELPIIPLFETGTALDNSKKIISELLENKQYTKLIKTKFNNYLEIMLGYSDSSKGMGVMASRLGIAKTMRSLDRLVTNASVTPLFFHGSGGSVDRGGGGIEEQTAWWPKSALQLYKATIQGEMVERSFSSSEVSLSGMNRILHGLDRTPKANGLIKINEEIEKFSALVRKHYETKISEQNFFRMVESATPYSYLNVLKLGSRPSKRSTAGVLDFSSIRAIPWVLCWTQTRTLFPTWWGVGSAWQQYKNNENDFQKLKNSWQESNLFQSFVRLLGFTLSKVDLQVFALYLSTSNLSAKEQRSTWSEFENEYKLACEFVHHVTDENLLLWFKPWLQDSISLRSSMIHPLNVLQIIGKKNNDEKLVRKTVAGISSGMMTTG